MDEFKLFKEPQIFVKKEWSFLETIGVSHRETIIANLLRYFFDPNEKHELGDTFIKALLQTTPFSLELKEKNEIPTFNSSSFSWADVNVEEPTDNKNRIDILIETEDLVIVVEFKINHYLNNPLEDYVNHIEGFDKNKKKIKSKYDEKQKYYIVLTPAWKKPEGKAKNNKEFKQIMISHFIDNVEKMVNATIIKNNLNTHQQHIYQDFITTIKNRAKTMNMINDYFEKIKTGDLNIENIENAFKNLNIIKMHLEEKTDQLMKYLNKANGEIYSTLTATKDRIESALVKNIDNKKQIKIRLTLKGWNIEFWCKKTNKFELINSENICNELNFSEKEIELKLNELENKWQTKNKS